MGGTVMVRGSAVIIVMALIICVTITALAPETGWWQTAKIVVLFAGVFFAKLVRRVENNPYWRRWAPKMPPA
jgi:hypothetical protein